MIKKLIPRSVINIGKHFPEAFLANMQYGFPGQRLRVIGITGTDGKTTTVNMVYQMLKDAGKKVSMLSTINAFVAGKPYDTGFHVTSPHPKDIQKYLQMSLKNGDEFMVLEVTSHALAQYRVWGIPFEIGVITNITHEHLDYHKTFENYLSTKAKLIESAKYAVLNYDDDHFFKLTKLAKGNVVSFGKNKPAFINQKEYSLKLKIPGDYNIYNALAAASVGYLLELPKTQIIKSLNSFTSLTGRMEEIENKKGIKIYVDFAHTPHALESVLKSLKPVKKTQKLIVVFGSASERDIQKRPIMGEIAAKLADVVVLTDEDPRFEDRDKIIQEIAQGAKKGGLIEKKNLYLEKDRMKAIKLAISLAKKSDIVIICGKGHEKSMNYKGKEVAWSDQEAVKKILKHG